MNVGRAGARVASAVILRQGATTTDEEALQLVQGMPDSTVAPHTPLLTKKDEALMQKRIQCL